MFKSILPSRRIPSGNFEMLTSPVSPLETEPNGKENYFNYDSSEPKGRTEKRKKAKTKEQPAEEGLPSEDFERLLDELQIPNTLRPKLATMDPTVKAAFLKSSHVLAQIKPSAATEPPMTPRGFRKAHSSESLASPRPQKPSLEEYDLSRTTNIPFGTAGHARGVSMDVRGRSLGVRVEPIAPLKTSKQKRSKSVAAMPEKYINILLSQSSTQLDVEIVKKLRLLLRNEAATWTEAFINQGGYRAILTRLNEILEVEWREEQHDDQILHELLRCVKAFSTSAAGCNALRSYCPSPFAQLISLLYSDKRPGDIGTRQLIVELLMNLFDLYPPSALPSNGSPNGYFHSRTRSVPWESESSVRSPSGLITLPAPHSTLFSMIRALLLTPAPPPSEAPGTPVEPHSFIEELHRPRIYKTYLQELSDICRDYFWVFCHPNNTIWNLDETDEAKVEKPRAPGGMTGGVEFEAMTYMTMHFRFLNAIANSVHELNLPKDHEHSAYQFHKDLFLSGIERIILIARKASTTYYPTLHLEIARYVAAAGRSGHDIPWTLSRLIGQPPTGMRKTVPKSPTRPTAVSTPTTPTKRASPSYYPGGAAPPVSGSRKVTPMFS